MEVEGRFAPTLPRGSGNAVPHCEEAFLPEVGVKVRYLVGKVLDKHAFSSVCFLIQTAQCLDKTSTESPLMRSDNRGIIYYRSPSRRISLQHNNITRQRNH